MNLNTVTEVKRPLALEEIQGWRAGNAWLAGGTWLFSEPQIHTDTLIDLETLGWPSLTVSDAGLEIAATCRIAELYAFDGTRRVDGSLADPRVLPFVSLVVQDLERSDGRRQHRDVAAGRPDDLADGRARRRLRALAARRRPRARVPAIDFVTGQHANVLAPGELLRAIHLPVSALRRTPRFPPRLAHASRSLLGAADRHARDREICC